MLSQQSKLIGSGRTFKAILIAVFILLLAYLLNEYFENWTLGRQLDRYVADRIDKFSKDHSVNMVKRIEKVCDNVYVALGYGLANTIFIEAPKGLIVVDTQESMDAAQETFSDFRKISNSTVKAIIYTHFHTDHTSGTKAFLANTTEPVEIWGHPDLHELFEEFTLRLGSYAYRSGMRQFGSKLPNQLGCGIGKTLKFTDGNTRGYVRPTHFVTEPDMEVVIAGLNLRLMHMPGETEDQIAIWYQETQSLISGDNIYKAFPNLYAIRGNRFRDPLAWVNSIDKMRVLRPHILIPCHLEPLTGAATIRQILSDYGDAIQYVHDQTIRHMNLGTHPDEASRIIKLPDRLARNPYLKEFYGTIAWSVKGIYDGYIGWFHGHPEELSSLTPLERGTRLVQLAGGVNKAIAAAETAVEYNDSQWALELSSAILQIDSTNYDAKWIYVRSLVELAVLQTSSIGRNYYLTTAEEMARRLDIRIGERCRLNAFKSIEVVDFHRALPHRMIGDDCKNVELAVEYNITDTEDFIYIQLRGGLLEKVDQIDDSATRITFHVDKDTFFRLAAKKRKLFYMITSILQGRLWIEASLLSLWQFRKCIELSDFI